MSNFCANIILFFSNKKVKIINNKKYQAYMKYSNNKVLHTYLPLPSLQFPNTFFSPIEICFKMDRLVDLFIFPSPRFIFLEVLILVGWPTTLSSNDIVLPFSCNLEPCCQSRIFFLNSVWKWKSFIKYLAGKSCFRSKTCYFHC